MAINYIREQINERSISLVWIPTDKNVADLLTKPLAKDPFERHAAKLLSGHGGVIPMPVEIENSINHVFLDLLPSDLINSDDT
jgi:serine/threonine protein kinase